MSYINSIILTNFIFKPYNYLISITEYLYMTDINSIITTINENTTNTYVNLNNKLNYIDIDYKELSLEHKVSIYLILISIIFTMYCINLLIYYYEEHDNKLITNSFIDRFIKRFTNNITNINTSTNNNFITSGMFLESIEELNINNKYIINKMINNESTESNEMYSYYALIRVKMSNNITMNNTKNNILNNIPEKNINYINKEKNTFNTNDMYMIIKFVYSNKIEDLYNCKIYKIILNCMNVLNLNTHDDYKNKDFIILAISKENIINPNEFYDSLCNINYEYSNFKHINAINNNKLGFILLLPIKKIYDLFLDVYNNVIFESTAYHIDVKNNEYWYDNLLDELIY